MKRIYILLASLMLVGSVAFGEDKDSSNNNVTNTTGTQDISNQGGGTTSLSRGESFLVSLGMNDSSIVVGGEVGGAPKTSVAITTGSSLANQGTNPGHTPYTYTK